MASNEKGLICLISENSDYSSNHYASDEKLNLENEKLKLIIGHKNELIEQQKSEILALKEIIKLLKKITYIILLFKLRADLNILLKFVLFNFAIVTRIGCISHRLNPLSLTIQGKSP